MRPTEEETVDPIQCIPIYPELIYPVLISYPKYYEQNTTVYVYDIFRTFIVVFARHQQDIFSIKFLFNKV